jgi:hypothetical protein
MCNSHKVTERGSGTSFSINVSSIDDELKGEDFIRILSGQKFSGGSNHQSTGHVFGTNSIFISASLECKITLSKEEIISKIEIIFLVPSIELFNKEFLVFGFNSKSLEPVTSSFGVYGEGNISSIKPVFKSLIDHFEGLNEKSVEISPFSETYFIVSVSIGGSEDKFDFS